MQTQKPLEERWHTLRKEENGKWHIVQPDGTYIYNGFHKPIAFSQYWDAMQYCQYHGLPFKFDWQQNPLLSA